MTIPSSTVPAVRAALVAGITAQVNDRSVTVSNGPPKNSPDDIVAVMGARREALPNTQRGDGGAGWLQEQYRVEVVTRSFRGGDDFGAVDVRAWALNDAVDAYVRGDPSLGGLVLVARPESSEAEVPWEPNDKGVLVQVTTHIYVIAQI